MIKTKQTNQPNKTETLKHKTPNTNSTKTEITEGMDTDRTGSGWLYAWSSLTSGLLSPPT